MIFIFVVYTQYNGKIDGGVISLNASAYSTRYFVRLSIDGRGISKVTKDRLGQDSHIILATSGMPNYNYDVGKVLLYRSTESFVSKKLEPLAKKT